MPSRNTEKVKDGLKELERTISPVLVVNNSALKPYVELFEYSPENIYQQPLGSLVGFFEIKEYSDDSAYVVNFLTSVLKKEYYINPKRPVTESLDAALHKINLALSELAKHGNVEWLGKLNAAICVIEKNSAHFSVAGDASIFLYRGQTLTDISEGLASDTLEPHPLKTFVNVSSGRLEKNDRLLITAKDIFHILSLSDLKKNFQRFEDEKFVQFLKTALSNQLEMIASVVIEMKESVAEIAPKRFSANKKTPKIANVFSEKTFEEDVIENVASEALTEDEVELPRSEYTDKKTGHIYIQGESQDDVETSQTQLYLEIAKEKVADGWYHAKNATKRRIHLYKKQFEKRLEQQHIARQKRLEQVAEEKRQQQIMEEIEREEEAKRQLEAERQAAEENRIRLEVTIEEPLQETPEEILEEEIRLAQERIINRSRSQVIDLKKRPAKISQPEEEILVEEMVIEEEFATYPPEDESFEEEYVSGNEKIRRMTESTKSMARSFSSATATAFGTLGDKIARKRKPTAEESIQEESESALVPHFHKIKKLFNSFTFEQKLYAFIALVAIFVVPIFIARFLNRPKSPTITSIQATAPTLADTLAMDKKMNLSVSAQTALSRNDIVTTLITSSSPVAVTKNSLIVLDGQSKEYPLPQGSGSAVRSAFMNDLSLVFVLTDQNKIISFSPTSLKFTDNAINLDGVSNSSFIGTYLTYLYVLDGKANQVYRYPRATGGFGDKTNWYKDTVSLASASDMTIDDNIYTIQNNQVQKFFKGKQASITLEASNTPVHFDNIFTTVDSTSLYVLDTKNARVIQYAKDSGQITAQYFNEALKTGTSLSVDEKTKAAYVATPSGLISISIQ